MKFLFELSHTPSIRTGVIEYGEKHGNNAGFPINNEVIKY